MALLINPIQVLLADDDQDDCLLFSEVLEEFIIPSQLQIVHDGEALMLLLRDRSKNLPDILFLDLNMPRKNGFDCLIEIKHSPDLSPLPVIIFTTSTEHALIERSYTAGALHFISKPANFAQFRTEIHSVLTETYTQSQALQQHSLLS